MDKKLLNLYNQELNYLRSMGGEFAREFPKIAGRLGGLDESQPCEDPFVERLLEGFAFLAARVQLKLDSEFPRFTHSLLDIVYPHYLAPLPSMTIVQMTPDMDDPDLQEGFPVPRETSLFGMLGKTEQTRCQYKTVHDTTLWPIEIESAKYYTNDMEALSLPPREGAKAALQIRLRTGNHIPFCEIPCEGLSFYIEGASNAATLLYQQLFADSMSLVIQPVERPFKWQIVQDRSRIQQIGFDSDQRLLPYDGRSFQGYRLMQEFFAFPQRFMFAGVTGLRQAFSKCESDQIDLVIPFDKSHYELANIVSKDNFQLYCTPAINLFKKNADRIHITDKSYEYHVIPDRTKSQDFEVYSVRNVLGYGTHSEEVTEFSPFYKSGNDFYTYEHKPAYYMVNRIPRTLSANEKLYGARSKQYSGSDVYISLVDTKCQPFSPEIRQLGVETLCTNRDLPLYLPRGLGKSDFDTEVNIPCQSIRSITNPSRPKASFIEGQTSWRAINHFSLNYLSLTNTDHGEAAAAMQDILKLYAPSNDDSIIKQIEGIKSITTKPITKRVKYQDSVAFIRGLQIRVTLDVDAYQGVGAILMGAVLERFFAKYVSMNSFTETIIQTTDRELITWPIQTGLRQIL